MLQALAMRSPSAPGQVPPNGMKREEARVVAAAREREHVALEPVEDLVERLRARAAAGREPLAHLGRRRRGGSAGSSRCEPLDE